MAYPTIPNTFVNSTIASAPEVNENFNDLIEGFNGTSPKDISVSHVTATGLDVASTATFSGTMVADGTSEFNGSAEFSSSADFNSTLYMGTDVRYEFPAQGMYATPKNSLEHTGLATITVKAGRYFIGDKVYSMGTGTEWSWNLDSGVEANGAWYYMHVYADGSTVTPIASTKVPTKAYDNVLSGTCTTTDTNVYCGAFYNDAVGSVRPFVSNGNLTLTYDTDYDQNTSGTTYLTTPCSVPETANMVYGTLSLNMVNSGPTGATNFANVSPDGSYVFRSTDTYSNLEATSVTRRNTGFVPMPGTQTVYIALAQPGGGSWHCYWQTLGWTDKYV